MKRIIEQNYYELLDIPPKASTQEVQWAYDRAMNLFSADSIATYSLLSKKERELILSRIVEAYKTLTNSTLRAEYNQLLFDNGELLPENLGIFPLEEPGTANGKLRKVKLESLFTGEKIEENSMPPADDSLTLINIDTAATGKNIQALRIARKITIEDIHRKTNIPKKTLEDIEEDRFEELPPLVYLKGFLKAYARILRANESQMVDGYMKRFLEWKASFQR